MKVLVIGASGFIGLPTARALSRAGHEVFGLTRSQAKGNQLLADEITPVIGEPEKPEDWVQIVSTLDVVIECIGGTANISVLGASLLQAVSSAAKAFRPVGAPKLSYIYTSGTWVHGDNKTDIVIDTTPITNPVQLVAWRPAHEQRVVTDSIVNGIVVRPALLYGGSASLLAPLYKAASEGRVRWFGRPGGRYAVIHFDDLADLYVRVAEKAQLVGGLIFDAATSQSESTDDFLQKLVEISGAKGPYEYVEPSTLYESAISASSIVRPHLARDLLGWQPRKAGLVDGLQTWYRAWQASAGTTATGHWSDHVQ
ncbi:hypothetical protein EWM64_g2981 [Hericium alpestre]|uniref:NAD-dependent epimerase/dehydratase domain-containing protein n=1 Tax=Hericium alpestre TaxID=135208 RepID=A0A4Z0A5Q8_9AGAM|nr:hypothetical protein EWM64_g2981 [Hericium alpestre]